MQEFTAVYASIKGDRVASAQCIQLSAESLPDAYEKADERVEGDAAQLVLVARGRVEAFREGGLVTAENDE